MANRVHPTLIDADNISGSLPAACIDWRIGDADSMSARTTPESTLDAGYIHGRPQFARRSHVVDKQEKIADIHSVFRRAARFDPDGMRWLAPQQDFELEARYIRQV